MYQTTLTFQTHKRSFINITKDINLAIKQHASETGLCNLFIQHTSASLIICENADPAVRADLENYFSDLIKDGDPRFSHCDEGEDDMSAHIRTILTESSIVIPIQNHQLALGTWQGIYLWEHRYNQQTRKIIVTLY